MKQINYSLYEVGGAVRDRFLGIENPKDIDYSVVIENKEDFETPQEAFKALSFDLMKKGYEIFLETPEMYTIRGKFPKDHKMSGMAADFVLARKELGYESGSRRPKVVLGTLHDDLYRRDFTVNAMAMDLNGELIDPFNGITDLFDRVLRTPGNTVVSFNNDPLRILRAIRFKITKGFEFSDIITKSLKFFDGDALLDVVSLERIREELHKSFKHDTFKTLEVLFTLRDINFRLYENILGANTRLKEKLWLEPTTKS